MAEMELDFQATQKSEEIDEKESYANLLITFAGRLEEEELLEIHEGKLSDGRECFFLVLPKEKWELVDEILKLKK